MFGKTTLKPKLVYQEDRTPCPVMDCGRWVARQQKRFLCTPEYFCPDHRIFISRSTFEYEDKFDNLLWTDRYDRELLYRIGQVKRESRMARDNSEDAVTWNVLRHLDRSGRLVEWLTHVTGIATTNPRVIYWSFCQESGATSPLLAESRAAFREPDRRGSEPDLVVDTDSAIFFIEAKLTSSNNTQPSDPSRQKRYVFGADGWFANVVTSDFAKIAVEEKRYELLRLWLLGTWIAEKRAKTFGLINLVRDPYESDIAKSMSSHLKTSRQRLLKRATWEQIYDLVASSTPHSADDTRLLSYMREKAVGYDHNGVLRRAFALGEA